MVSEVPVYGAVARCHARAEQCGGGGGIVVHHSLRQYVLALGLEEQEVC